MYCCRTPATDIFQLPCLPTDLPGILDFQETMFMKDSGNRLLKITTTAVFIALTCVLTMAVRIPSPTKGYLNFGDCAVLFSGFLLGPVWGAVAGGVGSALADLLTGYPVYIPGTLIIKALMALVVSALPGLISGHEKKRPRIGFALSAVIAELLMTAGYYVYEAVFIGIGFTAAFAGVLGNIVQGAVGVLGAYFLIEALSRTDFFRRYGANGFAKRKDR